MAVVFMFVDERCNDTSGFLGTFAHGRLHASTRMPGTGQFPETWEQPSPRQAYCLRGYATSDLAFCEAFMAVACFGGILEKPLLEEVILVCRRINLEERRFLLPLSHRRKASGQDKLTAPLLSKSRAPRYR